MAITVRDILTLKSMGHFVLIAGGSGLSKIVEMVDMLDYGWERDKTYSLNLFDRHSFAISSLMFAKDAPDKLRVTIRRLIECGVVGLAYKPVFYKELPKEICQLADENAFPIFRIDDNIPYREIICDVSDAVRLNKNILETAEHLQQMMSENLKDEEVSLLVSKISPYLRKNARVSIILNTEDKDPFSIDRIIRGFQMHDQFKDKVALCRFASGLAVIATSSAEDTQKFKVIVNNVLALCNIKRDSMQLSHSDIHPTYTMLDRCVREAYYGIVAGQVLDRHDVEFGKIGTLSFLIPLANSSYIQTYMNNYLSPIIDDEEYMRTAAAFIRAEGDYEAAAKKLGYHKNTLRYRINKIHLSLSPGLSYEAFYEKFSIAVKTYLIKQVCV